MGLFDRFLKKRHPVPDAAPAKAGGVQPGWEEPDGIIGYRESVTGCTSYRFREGGEELCVISRFSMPTAPVVARGFGCSWRSGDSPTIMPGARRGVFDESGATAAEIVYRGPGDFEIVLPEQNDSLSVRCGEKRRSFVLDGREIASMEIIEAGTVQVPGNLSDELEPCYRVTLTDGMTPRMKLAVFAFPMLQFAA